MKSKLAKRELWANLTMYNFDTLVPQHLWDHVTKLFGNDSSVHAFANKLAGKLFWETDFALFAIDEYKRFVYLGLVADFMVTPSKVIDQVWHEHILFTKAYRDFCDNVIFYDFDHFPELVPHDNQSDIYKVQYQKTIDLYRYEFNEEPPGEIWGTTKFNTLKTSNTAFKTNSPVSASATSTTTVIRRGGMGMYGGGGGGGMMNNDPAMMNNGPGVLDNLPLYMMMQDILDNMQNQQQQNYDNQQQQDYNNQQNLNQQDNYTPGQDSTYTTNNNYQDNNTQDDYQDAGSDDTSYDTADVSSDGGDSSSCGSGDSGCSSGCSSCGGGD